MESGKDIVISVLDETIPPCRECEKHFFNQQQTFNWIEAGVVLISILTLIVDLVTDTLVTCQYFASGEYAWGLLTLLFTLMPSIVIQFFSIRWYKMDEDMSTFKWIIHILQLGPLYRYIVVLQTGLEAKKSKDVRDFDLLYHQQSDVCMLRLFESFMESAPQVVLQLYIMVATNEENFFTGISATVSLVSLCWAIAIYSRIHRRVREDKKVVSWPGVVLQAVWRIGMISSRVVALVLFATVFKTYVFVVIGIHWLVMMIWVYLQETDFSSSWLEERLFNAVIAIIYIFCFFNLKEGTSRYRVFVFYTVIFVENVVLLLLWHSSPEAERDIYTEVGFTIVFAGFFIGVISMMLYYRFLHPHSSVRCCSRAKTIHQLCLQHEDVINVSKGLEAEISPRSHTPSPCPDFIINQHSPLAIPISQFTTPVSRPLSAKSSRLLESIPDADMEFLVVGEGHSKPPYGRNVGLQRAKSDSCLIQEESVFEGNLSVARSAQGLVSSASKDKKQLYNWMEQYANERKTFTKNVLDALKMGKGSTEDIVKDMRKNLRGNQTDLNFDPHYGKSEQKSQAVLRVDSVSRKLLKGNADRKMHRSFRRQLRFEEKGENSAGSQKKETASVQSTKQQQSADHNKLPKDNVKAKALVFETLAVNNSLTDGPFKQGVTQMTSSEMDKVITKNDIQATSLVLTDKAASDYSNGDRISTGLQKQVSLSKQIPVDSHVTPETAKIDERSETQLDNEKLFTSSENMSHQQPTSLEKTSNGSLHCETHGLDLLMTKVPLKLELRLPCDREQSHKEIAATKLSGQSTAYSPLKPPHTGATSSQTQSLNSLALRKKSPLGEIQPKAELISGKQSKKLVDCSGKENTYQKKKPRKSFGQISIEDIKESIVKSPKKELTKSRRSVSRIPTDIVSSTVSRFTGTPDKK